LVLEAEAEVEAEAEDPGDDAPEKAPLKPETKRTRARWALGALLLLVAVLVGLTLRGLRDGPQPVSMNADGRAATTGPAQESPIAGPRVTPGLADETPPWRATPENTGALPAGTVPAWRVNPPRPDPSTPLPPPPIEPPNPAEHRPPMHNPGGVNGDRPERPVPPQE
jgi:hypothetical protein